MDELLYLSAFVGVVSAALGNRTSLALCLSLAASFYVSSSLLLWLLDLAVLCVILRPSMPIADKMVAALFLFAWPAYLMGEDVRYYVGYAVVVLQFAICMPFHAIRDEAQIASDFASDVIGFIRSRLSMAAARMSMG